MEEKTTVEKRIIPEVIEETPEKISPETEKEMPEITVPTPAVSYDAWDKLLQKYVSNTGKVNYKGFKSEQTELNAYLQSLSDNAAQNDWSRAKKNGLLD